MLRTVKDKLLWLPVHAVACIFALPVAIWISYQWLMGRRRPRQRQAVEDVVAAFTSRCGGRSGYITVAGYKIHYLEAGPTTGETVILLHGFPESAYSWRHVLRGLGDKYRVIALDLPGFGSTERVDGVQPSWWRATSQFGPEAIVPVIAGAVRALCSNDSGVLVPPALVGHDWGGIIAWQVAAQNPTLFTRLAVVNIPHMSRVARNMNVTRALHLAYVAFFQLPYLPEAMLALNDGSNFMKTLLKSRAFGVRNTAYLDATDIEVHRLSFNRSGATGALNYYRAMESWGSAARKCASDTPLAMPVLHLHGCDDRFVGMELLRGTDELVAPGFYTLKLVPGASHWLQQDAAPATIDALRMWLQQPLPKDKAPGRPSN